MALTVQAAPFNHFGWLKVKTRCALTDDFTAVECVDDASGVIRGMVGFCLWTPNSVQCHMAVETPIVWRHLLVPSLSYAFNEARVGRMVGVIPSHNDRSIAFAKRVGFQETHRILDGWAIGEDLAVLELTRHEASRWLCANRKAA